MLLAHTSALTLFVCSSTTLHADEILIPERTVKWRFLATKVPDEWTSTEFNDADWQSGVAPLGFGEPDLATLTSINANGSTVPMATFFRTSFDVDRVDAHSNLKLKIRVDDGFVAYLNGQEIQRWNLPAGTILQDSPATRALSAPEEQLYLQFDLSANALRKGENVIAVEVHQCNNRSTDLYLDLRLSRHTGSDHFLRQTYGKALEQSLAFNSSHVVKEGVQISDDFVDGGRGMQIDEFGNVVSAREVLRVDRKLDLNLQKHLAYARSSELAGLGSIDRATRIARYIDRLTTPADGRNTCESRSRFLQNSFASRDVLIGDVTDFCGAGVCRHRALLFKLMADEAGLACALVRGNYGVPPKISGHTWNELVLEDGQRVVVDVMNPQPDFYFPEITEQSLRHYRTIANAGKYPQDQDSAFVQPGE